MGATPTPPQLDDLGERTFSFYPPIVNVTHNEWRRKEGNWSEILVSNAKSDLEVWIPRSYLGEVSKTEEPFMIVGLRRELEYKGGAVWPHTRRVISMPGASRKPVFDETPEPERPSGLSAALSELRSNSGGAESGIGKIIGATVLAGIILCCVVAGVAHLRSSGRTIQFKSLVQADLGFTSTSDYFDVVRVLGKPSTDNWKADAGERQYRALSYPKDNLIIILMGADRDTAHYIGAKDQTWQTVHTVDLRNGRTTAPILRSLKRF